ncbi:DUF3791 domain-containing protein [Parabacteroides sp.]
MNQDNINVRDIILWNRIGRIVTKLSEKLQITPEEAFDIFYQSETCAQLHEEESGLYLYGELYIIDELIRELQDKQG